MDASSGTSLGCVQIEYRPRYAHLSMQMTITGSIFPVVEAEMQRARAAITQGGRPDPERADHLMKILSSAEYCKWDFSAPTIMQPVHPRIAASLPPRSEWVEAPKQDAYPTFKPIQLDSDALWHHVRNHKELEPVRLVPEQAFELGFIVAGGAVCDLLCGRTSVNDLDLFAPGMAALEAENRFSQLVRKLPHCSKQSIYRTTNCITVPAGTGGEPMIQLITRVYESPEHVVYGFDLAPCAVAWDGKKVTATVEARYMAYTLGIFGIDLSMRRSTFEYRASKYVRKGFALVLPTWTARQARASSPN